MFKITDTPNYDIGVRAFHHPATGLHFFFRRGTTHPGSSDGRMMHIIGADTDNYLPDLAFPDPGVGIDETEINGGVVSSTGTMVLFVNRYNRTTAGFEASIYRSTDGWLTNSFIGILDAGDGAAWGRMVELPSGRLLMSVFTISPSPRTWIVYSDDDGLTWHAGSNITTSNFNEGCLVCVGGSGLVYVARTGNPNDRMHQWRSTDGGVTWVDQGPLLFTSKNECVSPDIVSLEDGIIVLAWADRATYLLNWVKGVGADLLGYGTSVWSSVNSIYRSTIPNRPGSSRGEFGYPSMFFEGPAYLEGVNILFNDQNSTSANVGGPPTEISVNLLSCKVLREPITADLMSIARSNQIT